MFDTEDRSWTDRSLITANPYAEIAFHISPAFHPNPNDLDEARIIALPIPAGASIEPHWLTSTDVLENPLELIDYYKAVMRLARQHGHSYNAFEHHMSLGLHFGWSDGAIGFWYNTLDVMEPLFDWLNNGADGDMWHDVEQGWEMLAIRSASRFHFRQGGFDQGGEYVNVALPRDDLLVSISKLRARMRVIVEALTTEIGQDYWSRYRYDLRTDLA